MPTKRHDGEGTIRQRGNRFEGRIRMHGKQVSVYGDSPQEVIDAIAEKRKEAAEPASAVLVGEWLDKWLVGKKDRTAEATLFRAEQIVKTHLRPRFGGFRLRELTPAQVEKNLTRMREEGVSAGERARALAALRDVLNEALRLELISRNAAKSVRMPKVEAATARALSLSEYHRLTECFSPRYRPWLALAVDSGVRPSESFGLDWPDINWDAGTITVQRSYSIARHAPVLKATKTRKGLRTIVLASATLTQLRVHREAMRAEPRHAEEGPLFVGRQGARIARHNFSQRIFAPAVKRAGLDGVTMYTCRHTCASWLLAAGVPIRVVADRLGHEDITLTLATYAHTMEGQQASAAAAMAKILAGEGRNEGSQKSPNSVS